MQHKIIGTASEPKMQALWRETRGSGWAFHVCPDCGGKVGGGSWDVENGRCFVCQQKLDDTTEVASEGASVV